MINISPSNIFRVLLSRDRFTLECPENECPEGVGRIKFDKHNIVARNCHIPSLPRDTLAQIAQEALLNPLMLTAAKTGLTILMIFFQQKHLLENI